MQHHCNDLLHYAPVRSRLQCSRNESLINRTFYGVAVVAYGIVLPVESPFTSPFVCHTKCWSRLAYGIIVDMYLAVAAHYMVVQ